LTLAIAVLMALSSFAVLAAPGVSAASPNLAVNSQTTAGTALNGYWVEVTDTSGNVVQTGFTPAQFTLAAGNYIVSVGDYGGEYFGHWSDGTATRAHPVTIGASGSLTLTAIYCQTQGGCSGTSTGSSINVISQYSDGSALSGMYTVIQQGGQTVSTGFTPMTFSSTSGGIYTVTIDDYTNAYFSQWSSGVTTRTISVTATSSQASLTAVYCQTQGGCSSGSGGGGGGGANSITVTSSDLHTGASLTGFYVDLRQNNNHVQGGFTPVTFSGLQTGVQYLVVVYWYGSNYFRHFSNGNLQRYELVTLNSTAGQNSITLNALYESVPSAQAASVNIIAQFPNGTQIGTASTDNGYPQHTPGMYLTVTPPGGSGPFTATFTGGSILPFIFFNGQTYTVQMSTGYNNITFSYWKDNGSTDPTRSVPLNGNTTIIAIYTQA